MHVSTLAMAWRTITTHTIHLAPFVHSRNSHPYSNSLADLITTWVSSDSILAMSVTLIYVFISWSMLMSYVRWLTHNLWSIDFLWMSRFEWFLGWIWLLLWAETLIVVIWLVFMLRFLTLCKCSWSLWSILVRRRWPMVLMWFSWMSLFIFIYRRWSMMLMWFSWILWLCRSLRVVRFDRVDRLLTNRFIWSVWLCRVLFNRICVSHRFTCTKRFGC